MSLPFFSQGMSDLLSPILFVMEDESESFWCFVALMERLGPNFNRDQNGMHSQLFALSKVSLSIPPYKPIYFLFFSFFSEIYIYFDNSSIERYPILNLESVCFFSEIQRPFGLINFDDLLSCVTV
jgi:hypothetical protein